MFDPSELEVYLAVKATEPKATASAIANIIEDWRHHSAQITCDTKPLSLLSTISLLFLGVDHKVKIQGGMVFYGSTYTRLLHLEKEGYIQHKKQENGTSCKVTYYSHTAKPYPQNKLPGKIRAISFTA